MKLPPFFNRATWFPTSIFKVPVFRKKSQPTVVHNLIRQANEEIDATYKVYHTSINGLSSREARLRSARYGLNEIIQEKKEFWLIRLIRIVINPLVLLLVILASISFVTNDIPTTLIITIMILISSLLRFFQESQAYNSAHKLRSMIKTTCTVIRGGKAKEKDLKYVVPGDIIRLSAGDIVPADVRLITSKELFVDQSLLTGESLPVEKHVLIPGKKIYNPLEMQNLCFAGTNVESGTALAVILATGTHSYFGSIAKTIVGQRTLSSFDKGIDKYTWLMIGFMAIMTPLVFFINGLGKGNWWEAFLFAISVAVGLTPEMLPAIVTVNLSKGAIAMSKKQVIVKRLSSIQNFGAMNVLCTDKTGTLTQNRIVLIKNIDIYGNNSDYVLKLAYLNSYYQTGFKNLLDTAVLRHGKSKNIPLNLSNDYDKVDELPFDFKRRRLSIAIYDKKEKKQFLICKGAVEEVLEICTCCEENGKIRRLGKKDLDRVQNMSEGFGRDGFRVVAVAYKEVNDPPRHYSFQNENKLCLVGLMTFFDPPKETAVAAITSLQEKGIMVKMLTGDNDLVAKKIGSEVGLFSEQVLFGNAIEQMKEEKLIKLVEKTAIFAKLSPDHKRRIIQALQKNGHVVGFLGDGINDAPAMRVADVGISVNGAVDIAKESADIILLEKSLLVLTEGVIEGRKVFGNIVKYIRMGASSSFGNVISVVGASFLIPFLPMYPLQLLINNLLYDISQTTIPTDNIDPEYLDKPRKWEIGNIGRFMVYFGPISSFFDYITFAILIFVFHALSKPMLFQTGWFVESLLTQTLIVHVIRSRKVPFLQTRASTPLIATTLIIMAVGIYLTFSPFATVLNFVRLPYLYWIILFITLISYIMLTQAVKKMFARKYGYN